MILLDTHALLWATLDRGQLSATALGLIEEGERQEDGLLVLSVSFWEIALKSEKRKLRLPMSVSDFYRTCTALSCLRIEQSRAPEWIAAAQLEWAHRDPIDRLLVATSRAKAVPLLSKDQTIRQYHEDSLW